LRQVLSYSSANPVAENFEMLPETLENILEAGQTLVGLPIVS
jgi:hypothetical protein